MAIVTTDSKHYSNIAAAIREKTGDETTYTPEEIPAGIDEVYEAGKQEGTQSEYDRFWDIYQENGKRQKYEMAFTAFGWTDVTFKPKYDLILGDGHSGLRMFWSCQVINIVEAFEKQGVKFDTTQCGHLEGMFQAAVTTRIPEMNCSHAMDYGYGLAYTFTNASAKTIDKLIVPENLTYPYTFNGCTNLENITFEGTIGNNISFANSPLLTTESVQSIIDHLKDMTGQTAQTLTFHATVGAKMTDAQKATISSKNWTLVY